MALGTLAAVLVVLIPGLLAFISTRRRIPWLLRALQGVWVILIVILAWAVIRIYGNSRTVAVEPSSVTLEHLVMLVGLIYVIIAGAIGALIGAFAGRG